MGRPTKACLVSSDRLDSLTSGSDIPEGNYRRTVFPDSGIGSGGESATEIIERLPHGL